jgi:glutamate carboxypeptidase
MATLSVCFPADGHAQKLAPDEQRIVSYIDAHTSGAVALLERSVNIESPTEDLAGVRKVGKLFKAELDDLGFATRWVEMPPSMKRAGHLIAEKKGTSGKRILLLGHLDTVLRGERFRREGDRGYGTGTSDMKAGDVVILYALEALRDAGALRDASVIVVLMGDEESSGLPKDVRLASLIDAAKRSDLALSFDGGAKDGALSAERGQSYWDVVVTAKTGHSSHIFKPDIGAGAVFEAARILDAFRTTLGGEKYLSVNVGALAGGSQVDDKGTRAMVAGKGSVVPAKGLMWGDLRFISRRQELAARATMSDIVAHSLPGTSAKITYYEGLPAMPPSKANDDLLKMLDAVSRDLNFGGVTAEEPEGGATDLSEIAHLIPGLEDLGGIGAGDHARGEYVELNTLPMQIKRAALLIYRLTR